jgi:hypothetical protein
MTLSLPIWAFLEGGLLAVVHGSCAASLAFTLRVVDRALARRVAARRE